MAKLSKILTVFVAVASLAFAGFATTTWFGSPTWEEVMNESYFDGYTIAKSAGADPSWTATRSSDGGNVATSKALPEVLAKVMDEIEQQRQQEIQAFQAREPVLKTRIEQLEGLKPVDEAGLQKHISNLRDRLAELTQQESDLTSKVTNMATEARKIESQVVARREDVFRLGQQVEELKADLFRLKEIREQLRDVKYQLEEHLIRAEKRSNLLEKKYNPDSQ